MLRGCEIEAMSLSEELRSICEQLFNIIDTNKSGFIEQDEYDRVTLSSKKISEDPQQSSDQQKSSSTIVGGLRRIHSYLLPRSRWTWVEMDEDSDDKISSSEWLQGMGAIADFAGRDEFIVALRNWCKDIRTQQNLWPHHMPMR